MSVETTPGQKALRQVARPALFERMNRATEGPITLIVAPAGTGKSSLVRSWLAAAGAGRTAAWVSVERDEHEAQRFWNAVISQLRAARAGPVDSLPSSPRYDGSAAVAGLVQELDSLEDPLLLVIDDVHEISDAGIHSQLSYLLEHLPPLLQVVLISRREIQLGLHRRRLEGGLTEIRNDDLRFTLDEARLLLAARNILLPEALLMLLHDRTEGWVAGLQLAVVSLVRHPDRERFVVEFSGSDRTVAEYLTAEVLDLQAPEVRRLLLRAALLEKVNGALGDLITGSTGSARRLQELADSGAFVVALDPAGTWFRFHHLLAGLLALELQRSEPGVAESVHRDAATWFAAHQLPIEAITHAQAAGDDEVAAGILLQNYFSLTLDGHRASAHALLGVYTSESVSNPPAISVVIANDELVQGSLEQAAAHLGLAVREADRVPPWLRPQFDVALLLSRLKLAQRRGDYRSVLAEIDLPDTFIELRRSSDIAMNNDVRTLIALYLGIVEVWCGLIEVGAAHLVQARELARQSARPYLEVGALANWAHAESWSSFNRARVASWECIALGEEHGWGADPVIGPALVTLGAAFIQAGRLEEGERWLNRADRTLLVDSEPAVGAMLHLSRAALHIARGQDDKAVNSCREAERLGLQLVKRSSLAIQLKSSMLYAMLRAGQIEAVRSALNAMTSTDRDAGEVREVLAAVNLADDDPTAALHALAPTVDGSSQSHHNVVLVRSLILQAVAHDALGDRGASEDALEAALQLAARDTMILPFLFVSCRPLLERHPRYRTAQGAFVQEILDVFSGTPITGRDASVMPPVDSLSEAELRLMRYLPTNLTAAAMASALYITTNTVKTHIHHIYAKLGVHTRDEAVERARELGLLGQSARRG